MQLPVEQFQPQSFAPFLQGTQAAGQIIQNQYSPALYQQQLHQAMMNNQILRQQVPFAGPMAQAQLQQAQQLPKLTQAQTATTGTQGQLNLAEAYKTQMMARMYPYMLGMKNGGAQFITDGNGNIHMIWNPAQAIAAMNGQNGQQGGTVSVPNSNQSAPNSTPQNSNSQNPQSIATPAYGASSIPIGNGLPGYQGGSMMPNFSLAARDPRMGPAKGGEGGTYTNLSTGQTISSPTSKQTSMNQQAIEATDRVMPLLKDINTRTAPYTGIGGQIKLLYDRIANPNAAADYNSAETVDRKFAAEQLVKGIGVNATDETINMVQDGMVNHWYDTPTTYNARIKDIASILLRNKNVEQKVQSQGIPLNNGGTQDTQQLVGNPAVAPNPQAQVNNGSPPPGAVQAANNIPQSSPTSVPNAMRPLPLSGKQTRELGNLFGSSQQPQQISEPVHANRAAALKWYNGLNSTQQAQYRKSKGWQ